jgi:hypothetical protein
VFPLVRVDGEFIRAIGIVFLKVRESESWREACPTIFRFRDQNIFVRNE